MSSTSGDASEEVIDQFMTRRDLSESARWEESYNKKQCPECGGVHEPSATACSVCGWTPE